MKKSTKIWLALAGILLILMGIYCICHPATTLFKTAWIIGLLTLVTGIAKLVFTFRTQAFMPNSGTRMLSGLLLLILGFFILGHKLFATLSLPIVFALWVLVEGIIIAVQSFDYKKVGFPSWWVILILGIAGAVLGVFGLRNPEVTAKTLSTFIGIAVIVLGIAHLVALCGIKKIEKQVDLVEQALSE